MKIKLFIFIYLSFVSSLFADWFTLGRSVDRPFQIESSLEYENNFQYYDATVHKMVDFPEDWVYKTYYVTTRFGVYLTKNIRVRFSLPYSYIHEVRFDYSGEEFTGGQNFANSVIDIKYQFCYFKYGLWSILKKGSIIGSYLFDNGNKADVINSVSYGRNEIDAELDFEFFIFPKKLSLYLNKYLLLKTKSVYEKTGTVMTFIPEFSKAGFDRGDKVTQTVTLSFQMNNYLKFEGYWYFSYAFPLQDMNNLEVNDSYEYVHSIGPTIRWRVFGDSRLELSFEADFSISYKTAYASFFVPEVSAKFQF